jgi:30S ribosomal protein S31
MGRGDKRTKKGKIWRGSYGKSRVRKKKKAGKGGASSSSQPKQDG